MIGGCKLSSSGSVHQLSNRSSICSPRTPLREVINIMSNICFCRDSSEYSQTLRFILISQRSILGKVPCILWRWWLTQLGSVQLGFPSPHLSPHGESIKEQPPPPPSTWFPPPFLCFKNMKQT